MIWKSGPELTAHELHDLLRLRVDVFVVEQDCAYPELDGRDLLPSTWHGWVAGDSGTPVTASVRLLGDEDPWRIGRVVTAESARGQGLAKRLVLEAHERTPRLTSFLEAQSYLVEWYQALGWVVCGDEFVEDGIPHTPMRRGDG